MTEILTNLILNKNILILGFGKEGQSTYKLLKKIGGYKSLAISDLKQIELDDNLIIYSGQTYLEHIDEFDVCFKSPGIVLNKPYTEYNCLITSQTEMFLKAYNRQVIGITGTKGKSTTSTLLHHVLTSNNIPSQLAGNIGIPVFELEGSLDPKTIVVFEMSCHQLEICHYSPSIAVFLNIFEDHLDHYGGFLPYFNAKKNIYLNQFPLDILYCIDSTKPDKNASFGRVISVDSGVLPFSSFEQLGLSKLKGEHNLLNCAFVYNITRTLGVSDDNFLSALKTFNPLKHRLELIGTKNKVEYYDDSISTTVESTICAIESVKNASTILLGGMDRGIDYIGLVKYLKSCKLDNILLMYESGKKIYDYLQDEDMSSYNVEFCIDLYIATRRAMEITKKGDACLLSPAAASYTDFKNFEERGDVFKQIIFG